jgi:hypothetical protein
MTNERPHYFANKYSKVYIGALNSRPLKRLLSTVIQ